MPVSSRRSRPMNIKVWGGAALVLSALGFSLLGSSTGRAAIVPHGPQLAAADQRVSDPPFGDFLGACSTDGDCSNGNTCSTFKKRGSHCTHACRSDADCTGGVAARCTKLGRCG